MNKLSNEEVEELINDFGTRRGIIAKIEEILKDYDFSKEEYSLLIHEIISEYQTLKFNKIIKSEMTGSYKSLKDIIIKVLLYKLKDVMTENTIYEKEVNALILRLTN